jgi:hypothetical protein
MTPLEASVVIGCSARHVRYLCLKGKLKSERRKLPRPLGGFMYIISLQEARRYRDKETSGWPRGELRG